MQLLEKYLKFLPSQYCMNISQIKLTFLSTSYTLCIAIVDILHPLLFTTNPGLGWAGLEHVR